MKWFQEVEDQEFGLRLRSAGTVPRVSGLDLVPALAIGLETTPSPRIFRLDRGFPPSRPLLIPDVDLYTQLSPPCVLIRSDGLSAANLTRMWDRIALSDFEDEVTESLKLMRPRITRVSFVGAGQGKERTPRVRIEGFDEPVPLRSLGEGANRLFGMLVALVSAKDGMLLIDEVENGFHYSVQKDLWHLVLGLASRLGVQVFATTHSWDCVEAFQQASQENPREAGVLTRLESNNGSVSASQFTEKELDIARRERIEVR